MSVTYQTTSTYMQIPGIDGDVSEKNHKNWIHLDSVEFGVSRHFSTETGRVSNRESSKPDFSEVSITKSMDQASPKLMQAACKSDAKQQIKINLCRTDSDDLSAYAEITLSHVLISQYKLRHTNEGKPYETIKLNFDKIQIKYTPSDSSNQAQGPQVAAYDLSDGSIS